MLTHGMFKFLLKNTYLLSLTMRSLLLLLLLVSSISSSLMSSLMYQSEHRRLQVERHDSQRLEPDAYRNATELITSKGYPCENHYVTTEDGFILNLLRIPHGVNSTKEQTAPRPVVFLQHGLLGDCTSWILNSASQSLAFILADAGADVWLGNSRGTFYSMNHTVLKPTDDRFWNFTWDDMANLDLPVTLNFALATSNVPQLFYIGHSQGTTIAFAKFSEDQALAAKVKHFLAFAPVARLNHAKTPLRLLAPFGKTIGKFLNKFGHGSFGNTPEAKRILKGKHCEAKWRADVCEDILFLGCGFNKESMNLTRVAVYEAHSPSGTSTYNILHWAQEINALEFQKFDYGPSGNMIKYNQTTPPPYDPRNMKLPPVAIFRGGQDWLSSNEDNAWLLPQINVTLDKFVDFYEHLDFIWAMDAPKVIYPDVLRVIFGNEE